MGQRHARVVVVFRVLRGVDHGLCLLTRRKELRLVLPLESAVLVSARQLGRTQRFAVGNRGRRGPLDGGSLGLVDLQGNVVIQLYIAVIVVLRIVRAVIDEHTPRSHREHQIGVIPAEGAMRVSACQRGFTHFIAVGNRGRRGPLDVGSLGLDDVHDAEGCVGQHVVARARPAQRRALDSRALAGANLRVCDGGGGIRQVEIHLIPVKHASKAQAADAGEGQYLFAGVGQGRGAADRQGFGIDVNCDGATRAGGVVGVVAYEVHLHRLLLLRIRIGRHSLTCGCDGHLIRAADARDVRHGELHVTRAVIGLVGGGHVDRQRLLGDVHLRSRIGRKHHIVVVVRFAVAYHVDIIRPDWLVRAHSSVFHGAVGMDAVHRVADQHRVSVIGVRVANLLCAIVFAVGHGKAYIQVDGIDAQSTRNDAHFVIILCVREEDVRGGHTPCGRFFIRAKCAPITVRIAEAKGRLIEPQLVYQHSFRHTAGHRVLDIDVIQQVHIFRSIRTLIVHRKGIQRNLERRFLQFKGHRGSGRQRIVCSIVPCQLQKHLGLFVHCGVLVRDAHP